MTPRPKIPNAVLRRIREFERNETREEFARAVVEAGEAGLACDARHVARWEDGDVASPRPAYRRALEALTGRPFAELGFQPRNAMRTPSPDEPASGRVSFHVDEEGQVWATVDRRTFLVGSTATLLSAGVESTASAMPVLGATDPYGFAGFARDRWPDLRLSRPVPDYGVDYTAILPSGRTVDGAAMRLQFQRADPAGGQATVNLADPRWPEFSRGAGRGLLVGVDDSGESPRFLALDVREARRRTASPDTHTVAIPAAYELDDFTYGLLWACTSLDAGLQADDQELAAAREDLADYAKLTSSAVSREAASDVGVISQMWIGSDFCARHIVRNLDAVDSASVFWTREQRGEEACTWLLFDHKYPYLRATQTPSNGDAPVRMFCVPQAAVTDSPRHERALLFLAVALMEAAGIHVKVCDDPAYANLQGFVLGDGDQAIIANWVRGDGMWHVDRTHRTSVLREFREAAGYVHKHSVIEAATPAGRLQALAHYLDLDWSWLQQRCAQLAAVGSGGLLRPRSRLVSVAGVDAACSFVGRLEKAAA